MAPKMSERLRSMDLYALLGVDIDATEKQLKKAYRKRSLLCHPDKNPDNPKAEEEFNDLKQAYDLLCDEQLRKAYDQVLKARKASEVRNRQLDAKRKKLKDELEAREAAAAAGVFKQKSEAERREAEIQRLRKEGQRLLEEEQEKAREEMDAKRRRRASLPRVLMAKWRDADDEGSYDEDRLRSLFGRHGRIKNVVVKPAKKRRGKRSALVEMEDGFAALEASSAVRGSVECPIAVTIVSNGAEEEPEETPSRPTEPKPASTMSFEEREKEMMRNLEMAAMRQQRQKEEEQQQQEQSQNGYKDNVPSVNDNVPLSRDELRRLEEEKIRRQDELDDMNGAS